MNRLPTNQKYNLIAEELGGCAKHMENNYSLITEQEMEMNYEDAAHYSDCVTGEVNISDVDQDIDKVTKCRTASVMDDSNTSNQENMTTEIKRKLRSSTEAQTKSSRVAPVIPPELTPDSISTNNKLPISIEQRDSTEQHSNTRESSSSRYLFHQISKDPLHSHGQSKSNFYLGNACFFSFSISCQYIASVFPH